MILQPIRTLRDAERQVTKLIELDPAALDKAIKEAAGVFQSISPWRFEVGDNMR
ncbi:uncharacterized protein BDV17DRAFT_264653 [Aspergillus undulatus]|uniref:uncharacterized protein n=1 Tax=Aspergillus undulatus TaxID=1810928 RepID=UPI003CCDB6B2